MGYRRLSRILVFFVALTLLGFSLPILPVQAAATLAIDTNGVVAADPAPGGNNNSFVEPGETIQLTVTLRNSGDATASGVQGSLATTTTGVTVTTPTAPIRTSRSVAPAPTAPRSSSNWPAISPAASPSPLR